MNKNNNSKNKTFTSTSTTYYLLQKLSWISLPGNSVAYQNDMQFNII